ncbi:MAG: dephospho-CoA kinase [Mycoplasmatales bacterium]
MIIAIKGLIGSGKSTIANLLEEKHNFHVVNCDKIVHEMYSNDNDLTNKIVKTFNLEVFDTKVLGSIVFNDVDKLKELEKIVHPLLNFKCQEIIDLYENVVIDCQIIDKLEIEYDLSILATASIDIIIDRVSKRDNRTIEDIKKIIKIQEQNYLLEKRMYAVNTEENIEDVLDKIIRSFNANKNWENS